MKKILFSLFMSFIIMYFIWCIIIWIQYPDFIQNSNHYHLDLYAMLDKFNIGSDISVSFITIFKSFIDNFKKINTDSPIVRMLMSFVDKSPLSNSTSFFVLLNVVNALVNPIYSIYNSILVFGYLLALLVEFLSICTFLASAIFDFIFNPLVIIS